MKEKSIKYIHKIYAAILSLLVLTVGVLFILSCLKIYHSGSRPFSRESVAAAFSAIAVPVYLCIVFAVGAIPLSLCLPIKKAKSKATDLTEISLLRLAQKLDSEACPKELSDKIKHEQRLRKVLVSLLSLLYLVGAVVAILYVTNTANFQAQNANAEIINATLMLVWCLLPPFALSFLVVFLNHRSRVRELALTKEALRAQNGKFSETSEKKSKLASFKVWFEKHENTVTKALRIVLVAAGIACLIAGIWNGGANDVLQKAVKICTECIGLG